MAQGQDPTGSNLGRVAVGWTDPQTGSGWIQAIDSSAPWNFATDPLEVGINPKLRFALGNLFVLSDDGFVRRIDAERWTLDQTISLPAGAVPIDLAVIDAQTAYLTIEGATHLFRLDLATGVSQPVLDLSPFADADGVPDLGTMAVDGNRLFVQIQRRNTEDVQGYVPPGYLAVVDLASEQLIDTDPNIDGVQPIELQGTYPKHKMQIVPELGKLYVSATGGVFDEGGLEVIDLTSLASEGLVIHESDGLTGADLGPFVVDSTGDGFLSFTTDLTISSHLHRFDTRGSVEDEPLHVAVSYLAPALALDEATGALFFPIGGGIESGVMVFDAVTGEPVVDRLIPTSGEPTDLVRFVVPEPGGAAVWLAGGLVLAARRWRLRH